MVMALMRTLWLAAFLVSLAVAPASAAPAKLKEIETELVARFPQIGHITGDELSERMGLGESVVLLDVREEAEFAVSHLPGAIRIEPNSGPDAVLAAVGNVSGKRVVAYCSVGWRSSILADDTREALKSAGATQVDNLRGGIFAWHNESRTLANGAGNTDLVHPYDRTWGKLVERGDKRAYSLE